MPAVGKCQNLKNLIKTVCKFFSILCTSIAGFPPLDGRFFQHFDSKYFLLSSTAPLCKWFLKEANLRKKNYGRWNLPQICFNLSMVSVTPLKMRSAFLDEWTCEAFAFILEYLTMGTMMQWICQKCRWKSSQI